MRQTHRAIRARVATMVQQLRLSRGWSQEELAARAHMSTRHINRIELGRSTPTIDKLADIARALSVDASDLLGPRSRSANASRAYAITDQDLDPMRGIARLLHRLEHPRSRRGRSNPE